MNQLSSHQKAFNAICFKIERNPEEEGKNLAIVLVGGFPNVFRGVGEIQDEGVISQARRSSDWIRGRFHLLGKKQ